MQTEYVYCTDINILANQLIATIKETLNKQALVNIKVTEFSDDIDDNRVGVDEYIIVEKFNNNFRQSIEAISGKISDDDIK